MAREKFYGQIQFEPGTAAGDGVTKTQLDAAEANAKSRANHTGTQPSSTISDFQAAVETVVAAYLEIGATPATLNSLNELAAALGDDPNYAATTASQLAALDGRLDTLEGAGSAAPTMHTLAAGTSSIVTHGKGRRVIVQVVEIASGQIVFPVVTGNGASSNTVTIDFGATSIGANTHVALIL